MSQTSIGTGVNIGDLAVQKFNDMAFREYVQKLVLKPYMGTDSESMIHVEENLAKTQGDAIIFSLAKALTNSAVLGESTMEGNEEAQNFYSQRVVLEQYKNAVLIGGSMTIRRSPFDIKMEAKAALTTWLAQQVENKAFDRLSAIGSVSYGAATSTQANAWLVANADRILFGASVSNASSNVYATALLNIDTTADLLSTSQISLAKRMAQLASPIIRPIRIENGEEYYVMFVHPLCARDLKNSSAWQQAQREAQLRGFDNPIFTGMLGMWDGVILKETPKILKVVGVGATTSDVAQNLLCGAQSLLMGQGGYVDEAGAKVVMTDKLFDYDDKPGCQIKTTYGLEKAQFNGKSHGVVSVWSSASND